VVAEVALRQQSSANLHVGVNNWHACRSLCSTGFVFFL
jgi:hypothetical protein